MPPAFPANVLAIKTEILLNLVWTDISTYVYGRDNMTISNIGRADESSTIQPGQVTLTLNNAGGRFTPKFTSGAYYPYITRNVQLRISVNSQSSTGVVYSGYRFWGEVSQWPITWDPTAADVYCQITASGIWRRLSQNQQTIGSPMRRYYQNLTGGSVPQAYWSMEDGTGSLALISLTGAGPAVLSGIGTATPTLASDNDFLGSDAIPVLNAGTITATVPSGGTPTNNVIRFVLDVPAAGDSAQGTSNWNIMHAATSGTITSLDVYLMSNGTLQFQGLTGGTTSWTVTTTTNVKGIPLLVSVELTSGAYAIRIIKPGGASVLESQTGSHAMTIGAVTSVVFSRAGILSSTGMGQLAVIYGAVPSLVTAAYALNGYIGEYAMDRFTRLCTEFGIAYETIGTNTTTQAMGPQIDDTITNVLQVIEDTDCGLLYETRDIFGLGYRAQASMVAQSVELTLNYAASVLAGSLTPVYDDQLTRNNVVVTNYNGYTYQSILSSGAMSVQNPPNGIGNGYTYTRNISVAVNTQAAAIATFLLGIGSVDQERYPTLTIDLSRKAAAGLFSTVPSMRIGDYLQVTNPPAGFLTSSSINQLAWGWTETLNAFMWLFVFNAVPEAPWATGFSPGTVTAAQIQGQTVSGNASSAAEDTAGIGTTDLLNSVGLITTITTNGGNKVTVASTAPATGNLNDQWINSVTGLISTWNGTSWTAVLFNATNTIQAGTVTATQILASTITAAQIASGIVIAGIVNATNISAATYVATSSAGEFLAYSSSSPGSGTLINSIAGSSGTDGSGNPYPQGFFGQQLTLENQSSAPAAFSGASVFYSSTAGRPYFVSSSGSSSILDRSVTNIANFVVGNTTTPSVISSPMTYYAGEGNQSSEYSIAINGNGAGSVTSANSLTFQVYIDGSLAGGGFTIGATFWSVGGNGLPNFRYGLRFYISIATTGSGGTVNIMSDGSACNSGNFQAGASSSTVACGGISTGVSFDTTSSHTLQVYASWGGTATGQTLQTWRTKLSRTD